MNADIARDARFRGAVYFQFFRLNEPVFLPAFRNIVAIPFSFLTVLPPGFYFPAGPGPPDLTPPISGSTSWGISRTTPKWRFPSAGHPSTAGFP